MHALAWNRKFSKCVFIKENFKKLRLAFTVLVLRILMEIHPHTGEKRKSWRIYNLFLSVYRAAVMEWKGLTLIKKSWLWYWYMLCNKIVVSAHISKWLKLMMILFEVWRFWRGRCGLRGICIRPLNCRKGVWVPVKMCIADAVLTVCCA